MQEHLLDVSLWMNVMEQVHDCVIARLTVRSLQDRSVRGIADPGIKPPAWRLSGKRLAEKLNQPPPKRVDPVPAPPSRVAGVRASKSLENRFKCHETGDFKCTLCNHSFLLS